MTLHVYSARISYRGSDRLDVTRKPGNRAILRACILPKLGRWIVEK